MKQQKKTVVLQKICCYGSMIINSLLMWPIYAFAKKDYDALFYGVVCFVVAIGLGWLRISRDISLNDLSLSSVIIDCIIAVGLAGICTCFAYITALWLGVILTIAIVLEIIIMIIIPYRYRIWNKIKSKRKSKK